MKQCYLDLFGLLALLDCCRVTEGLLDHLDFRVFRAVLELVDIRYCTVDQMTT